MSITNCLPTKLSYSPKVPANAGRNVLDFERFQVHLWNKQNLTQKERRLFDKLGQWNNIWVARENGFIWSQKCGDQGYFDTWKGRISCNCPVTAYKESAVIYLSEEGQLHEERVRNTPKVCRICHSMDCSFVTNGRYFYYVCNSEECQQRINEEQEQLFTPN